MRIDAEAGERELGHVGTPDRNEPGRAQPRHGRRIMLRRLRIPQRDRARRGHVARDIEQILDRDRNAGERRRCGSTRTNAIVRIRRRERVRGMDLEKNAPAFSGLIRDPRQTLLDQAAAFAAAGEFGFDLGERWHCLKRRGRKSRAC